MEEGSSVRFRFKIAPLRHDKGLVCDPLHHYLVLYVAGSSRTDKQMWLVRDGGCISMERTPVLERIGQIIK